LTKRERYLSALKNESVDSLVWAPNFDYWLAVNTAENTIPEKYRDMSRNDIVRAVPQKERSGFILGMSDNVPPNADFSRIEMIADAIE